MRFTASLIRSGTLCTCRINLGDRMHEPELLRRLAAFPMRPFSGEVFRFTSMLRDATEASANGGRWGLPQGNSVLYTSMEKDGAVIEVASYLIMLSPLPRSNPMKLSHLKVTASKVITLTMENLAALGVDPTRYGTRDYFLTQQIGAALEHLGADALISPSARSACNNLTIFQAQHNFEESVEVIDTEEIEWRDWARRKGMLDGLE